LTHYGLVQRFGDVTLVQNALFLRAGILIGDFARKRIYGDVETRSDPFTDEHIVPFGLAEHTN
jgi:hypothetical protein